VAAVAATHPTPHELAGEAPKAPAKRKKSPK
jgi:hypothetical protein